MIIQYRSLSSYNKIIFATGLFLMFLFLKSSSNYKLNEISFTDGTKSFSYGEGFVDNTLYDIKAKIYTVVGDIKIYKVGTKLIKHDQIDIFKEKLKPGDLIFSRHDWYISDAVFPGFWPHIAMYTGNISELADFFKNSQKVNNYIRSKGFKNIKEYFEKKYGFINNKYKDWKCDVVESTSDGVNYTSVHYTAYADYVAALRPKLSLYDKFIMLEHSFENVGKEYDFNFDYSDSSKMVCTELIYESIKDNQSSIKDYFNFCYEYDLWVINANKSLMNIAADKDNRDFPFQFVSFLEGNDSKNEAFFSTEKRFWDSCRWKGVFIPENNI